MLFDTPFFQPYFYAMDVLFQNMTEVKSYVAKLTFELANPGSTVRIAMDCAMDAEVTSANIECLDKYVQ